MDKELKLTDDNLKPYPFCGSHAYIVDEFPEHSSCYVQCAKCFARTEGYFSRNDAVNAWNKRTENSGTSTDINSELWDNTLNSLFTAVSTIKELTKRTPYQF